MKTPASPKRLLHKVTEQCFTHNTIFLIFNSATVRLSRTLGRNLWWVKKTKRKRFNLNCWIHWLFSFFVLFLHQILNPNTALETQIPPHPKNQKINLKKLQKKKQILQMIQSIALNAPKFIQTIYIYSTYSWKIGNLCGSTTQTIIHTLRIKDQANQTPQTVIIRANIPISSCWDRGLHFRYVPNVV